MSADLDARLIDQVETALAMGVKGERWEARAIASLAPELAQASPLTLTALAAAMRRFVRPKAPATFDPLPRFEEARLPATPEIREALEKILLDKSNLPSLAIADAFARGNYYFHPFDLVYYESFVRAFAPLLGVRAQAFVQTGAATEPPPQDYFAADPHEALTDETWTKAAPTAQASFFRTRRMQDPAAARALAQAAFPTLSAPARTAILNCFETGLDVPDLQFLESLRKDRAPKVREIAESRLARLPGTEAFELRLNRALEGLEIKESDAKDPKQSGGAKIKLKSAYAVGSAQEADWAAALYGGLPLAPLAARLNCDLVALFADIDYDGPLFRALVRQALVEGRLEILTQARSEGDLGFVLLRILTRKPFEMDLAERHRLAKTFFANPATLQLQTPLELTTLYEFLRAPLPEDAAAALLAAVAHIVKFAQPEDEADKVAQAERVTKLVALAALTPSALRPRLIDLLTQPPPTDAQDALNLAQALALLDPA